VGKMLKYKLDAERRWAAKLIRKEIEVNLPDLD